MAEAADPAGPGSDRIWGGVGQDHLHSGTANDTLDGQEDDDTFWAGHFPDGADSFRGGGGTDHVDYNERSGGVSVSFDGFANDGDTAASEGDNVLADIEVGPDGDQLLALDGEVDSLYGGSGSDGCTYDGVDTVSSCP